MTCNGDTFTFTNVQLTPTGIYNPEACESDICRGAQTMEENTDKYKVGFPD